MFLRKLFSRNNKFTWVLLDLLIVIIGVYCAFWVQTYAEDQKTQKESEKVLTALKYELEFFRYRMFETKLGMEGRLRELQAVKAKGTYVPFQNYRFIEPQYDYQTIVYTLNLQSNEIVDFELYNVLQSLFVEIKKIEHVERLLTETARRYRSIPEKLKPRQESYQQLWMENYDNFTRFVTLISDRAQISGRIAEASANALPLINSRLGSKKTKAVEQDLIEQSTHLVDSEEEAVQLARRLFPSFTEAEIRSIYQKAKKE